MTPSRPPHLVLVGLMGAGKTTIGQRCAERLGRQFIDTDDLVRRITPETRVLLLSHMRGHMANMDDVLAICERHRLYARLGGATRALPPHPKDAGAA